MLTAREQRFVNAYLGEAAGNGGKAAILAGYKKAGSRVAATRLLKKPAVRDAIANKQQRLDNTSDITIDRVLTELSAIAFSDVRALFDDAGNLRPPHALSPDVARAVASIEVTKQRTFKAGETTSEEWLHKVKQWDKLRAIELIAKLRGMFPSEKHEHTVSVPLFALPVGAAPSVSKES